MEQMMSIEHVEELQMQMSRICHWLADELNGHVSNVSITSVILINKLQTLIAEQGCALEQMKAQDNQFVHPEEPKCQKTNILKR